MPSPSQHNTQGLGGNRSTIDNGLKNHAHDGAEGSGPIKSHRPARPRPAWVIHPERGNIWVMRFLVWVALSLGRPAARLMLYPVCVYLMIISPASYAASTKYLRKILDHEPGIADAFRHCHTFIAMLLDRVFLLNDQYAQFNVRVHNEDIFAKLTAPGAGYFLLGAHMGSFEVIRALGKANTAIRVNLAMYGENVEKFNAVLNAINPALSLEVIALGTIDSMLKVEAALNRGEIVGMLGDRTFQSEGTAVCPFLGELARFPKGPFRLAAALKRPIVLMFGLYRGGNRYDIYFERLVDTWQVPGASRPVLIERALHRYAQRLEHYCRNAPYNWYNFYDFWQ